MLTPATQGDFSVVVDAGLWSNTRVAVHGTVTVVGSWGRQESTTVTLPPAVGAGNTTMVRVIVPAKSADYSLWWPNGLGCGGWHAPGHAPTGCTPRPMYNVSVEWVPTSTPTHTDATGQTRAAHTADVTRVTASRRVAFRYERARCDSLRIR